jgi:hypothetical protein
LLKQEQLQLVVVVTVALMAAKVVAIHVTVLVKVDVMPIAFRETVTTLAQEDVKVHVAEHVVTLLINKFVEFKLGVSYGSFHMVHLM